MPEVALIVIVVHVLSEVIVIVEAQRPGLSAEDAPVVVIASILEHAPLSVARLHTWLIDLDLAGVALLLDEVGLSCGDLQHSRSRNHKDGRHL